MKLWLSLLLCAEIDCNNQKHNVGRGFCYDFYGILLLKVKNLHSNEHDVCNSVEYCI